jgi:hypothetical protein
MELYAIPGKSVGQALELVMEAIVLSIGNNPFNILNTWNGYVNRATNGGQD